MYCVWVLRRVTTHKHIVKIYENACSIFLTAVDTSWSDVRWPDSNLKNPYCGLFGVFRGRGGDGQRPPTSGVFIAKAVSRACTVNLRIHANRTYAAISSGVIAGWHGGAILRSEALYSEWSSEIHKFWILFLFFGIRVVLLKETKV